MRYSKSAVFKNSDAEFSQYENEDLTFSVTSIGEGEPPNCNECKSLRKCIQMHMRDMESKSSLPFTGISIRIETIEGRYLADTKITADNFRNREKEDIPRLTRDMYREFGEVIPCMSNPV